MESNNETWFLVLDKDSNLLKTMGAYKLKTIMNCKEMNILPKHNKH